MNKSDITILGDYIEQECVDFEGSLSFSIKAAYIEKGKLWKSKDITAEFLGNFWKNMLDKDVIKSTVHFVCAELMENAVYHSVTSDYIIKIQLCFSLDELLIYVKNSTQTEHIEDFKKFILLVLEAENLQKLFIQRMKAAKKSGIKRSQVGLITIIKDRGAKLSWKLEQGPELTSITTLARISLKGKDTKNEN
ncbi:MAG: hypothetical protein GY795_00555 [Desulfobacterales bacterium]|nr:hypothetical protein [Desulfobacterales bacterium]